MKREPRVGVDIGRAAAASVRVRHAADVDAATDHMEHDLDAARLAAAAAYGSDVDDAAPHERAADGIIHWSSRYLSRIGLRLSLRRRAAAAIRAPRPGLETGPGGAGGGRLRRFR